MNNNQQLGPPVTLMSFPIQSNQAAIVRKGKCDFTITTTPYTKNQYLQTLQTNQLNRYSYGHWYFKRTIS